MSDNNLINALITSSISIGLYGSYKIIRNYQLHSECNKNNELVISVVDVEKQVKQSPTLKPTEIELPSLSPLH